MMKPSLDGYDDEEALAAEYALGLLSPAEADEAERRTATDRAFRLEVAAWRERLSGLAAGTAPVNAPARVKKAVDIRLFARKGTYASGFTGFVIGVFTAAAIAAAILIIFFPPGR